MTRAKKVMAWSGAGILVLLIALLGSVSWLLFTTAGARWVAGQATSRFVPQVSYASIDGTIAGVLVVRDLRFTGPPDVAQIRIGRLTVDPTLSMLFSRVLRIERAEVEALVLTVPQQPKPENDDPLWIEPPVEIQVKDFALRDGVVIKGNERLARVKQLGIEARWTRDELTIDRLELLSGDITGDLAVKGRVVPSEKTVHAELNAAWKRVVIPERLAGRVLATNGELVVDGTPERYALSSHGEVGPPGDPTKFAFQVNGTDTQAFIKQLTLEQRAGSFAVNGDVTFKPVAWNIKVLARAFDPGALLADWSGRLNLDLATNGQMRDAGPAGHVEIAALSGELRGRPLAGGGALDFAAPSQMSGDLRVSSGRSRVAVKGESAGQQSVDATVDLSVASLNDWVPDTQGSLTGKFRVRGAWPKLTIGGAADGKGLGVGGARVARVHVEADVESPLDPAGKVRVTAQGVSAAGFEFSTVNVEASGNQVKHSLSLNAKGEKLNAVVGLSGAFERGAWRAELSKIELQSPGVPNVALRAPATISIDANRYEISQACFDAENGALCLTAKAEASGALSAHYSFDKVPLGLASALAPDALPGQLRGEVNGRGDVARSAAGAWTGQARIESAEARLTMDEDGTAALGQNSWLLYRELTVDAQLRGVTASARLAAGLQDGGTLKATLEARDLASAAPGLNGQIDASLPTIAPFAGFVPSVGSLNGAVSARISLGGTLKAPEITGTVDAKQLQADLGQLGIELRDGRVEAEAKRGGGFLLAGSVASGKGHVEFKGTMSERGVVDLKVLGQNFQAADIPAANVVLTPDLSLTGDRKGYLLKGEVSIPRADINIQKFPQDSPPGASPDVVVVRNGKEEVREAEASALPLTAAIRVRLGEQIKVAGYGLDATVAGQLDVRESPGMPTTGSGTLQVSGTYKAYGQDLTIKDGRLLFAGSPLDNPRLAIVAMRDISEKQSTGLRVAGTAKQPVITVISDPNVGEADALSYLVTGKSLNEVGTASGGSLDALASATRSLEGGAAGLVAKRVGQRLGLDEAGVEENEMIGGSALTIGEYLSPRLYLSYGVGLFEPGEVIGLRYKLSDDVGVKVQRGSEETRAGIEYRIER
jgi:translocation and assembly module TamB